MRRKYRHADLARDLERSAAWVSKYAKRGMPTRSAEAARAWCRQHLDPRWRRPLPGEEARPSAPAPQRAPDIADVFDLAGVDMVAHLVVALGVSVEDANIAVSAVCCALVEAGERLGVAGADALLFINGPLSYGPPPDELAVRRRAIEARIAVLRAEEAAEDA